MNAEKGEPKIQQGETKQEAEEPRELNGLPSSSAKITEQEISQLEQEDAEKLRQARRELGITEPMGTSDEKTIRKNVSEVPMPGGRMMGENVEWDKYRNIVEIVQNHFDLSPAELRRMLAIHAPFTETNFYEHLSEETKNPEIFANIVTNTIKFILKPYRKDVDEKYVLFYRRTQPADDPKPEAYWTYDYNVARRGLRQEHPEAYKKTTVILATSLETLKLQGTFEDDIKDSSIHLIEEKPFDQKLCISIWKPEGEKDDIPNELREKFENQEKVKEDIPIPQAQEINKKEEDDVW